MTAQSVHFIAAMKRSLLGFFLVLLAVPALAGDGEASFPEHDRELRDLDQNYNDRAQEFLSESEIGDRKMSVIELSEDDLDNLNLQVELEIAGGYESLKRSPFFFSDGKHRIYFLETAVPKALLPYKTSLPSWSTLFLSHNTRYVWRPDLQKEKSHFLKFRRLDGEPRLQREKALARTSLLTRLINERRPEHFDFYPESMTMTLRSKSTKKVLHAYIVRLAHPSRADQTKKLYPVHALFGQERESTVKTLPPNLVELSRVAGMTTEDWVNNEYMYKLGLFMAEAGLKYGIWPEAHTQNLLAEVDMRTGRISRFIFRDLSDSQIDSFVLAQDGKIFPSELASAAIMDVKKVDRQHTPYNSDRAREMLGEYLGAYMDYSLAHGDKRHFLTGFLDEAERLLGRPMRKGAALRRAIAGDMSALLDGGYRDPARRLPWHYGILQSIYNEFLSEKVKREHRPDAAEQEILAKEFIESMNEKRAVYSFHFSEIALTQFRTLYQKREGSSEQSLGELQFYLPHSSAKEGQGKISIQFHSENGQIYALNAVSGHVLGVAERAERVSGGSSMTCGVLFGRSSVR
ncbi:MAG: hypothetical protein NDI61_13580 [Bdellovibrionaceae bacterium]|nr:hypothetical protein [Pseudobdellovibrionaceae bacterium]